MCKLLGYKKFTGKNGKEYCVANVTTPYKDRDKERGCVGSDVQEIFLPEKQLNLLSPADIGKDLDLNYELSGGRAYLVDVSVKK